MSHKDLRTAHVAADFRIYTYIPNPTPLLNADGSHRVFQCNGCGKVPTWAKGRGWRCGCASHKEYIR